MPPSRTDEMVSLCHVFACVEVKKQEQTELHQLGKFPRPTEQRRDVRYGWDRKSHPISQSSCFVGDSSMLHFGTEEIIRVSGSQNVSVKCSMNNELRKCNCSMTMRIVHLHLLCSLFTDHVSFTFCDRAIAWTTSSLHSAAVEPAV